MGRFIVVRALYRSGTALLLVVNCFCLFRVLHLYA